MSAAGDGITLPLFGPSIDIPEKQKGEHRMTNPSNNTNAGDKPDIESWRAFCRRMESLGEQLLAPEFPQDATDRAEGVAHLAQQMVCWLGWTVGYGDPLRPAFQRQNDLVTPWGGPNAENVYRHARIDPARRYAIRGRMHACEDFILAMRAGFMHQAKWGTLKELTGSALGIGPGDEFEILLGGDGSQPGWHAIPEGAVTFSIREYYFDWQQDEPAHFTIECLDAGEPRPRLTPQVVAARLDDAASQVEHSIVYWNKYLREACDTHPRNQFTTTSQLVPLAKGNTAGKGLSIARYSHCAYVLEPDEALWFECDLPQARYWSFQIYNLGWFQLIDFRDRICSLNHAQTQVSADGRLRCVLSHGDPGVPNWLDAGGRREGLLTLRCFWPTSEPPTPVARVVKLADVASLRLPGEAVVDAETRRAQMQQRARHLDWRFRT